MIVVVAVVMFDYLTFNVSMGHQGSYQLCLMQDTGPVDRLFRWVVAHQMEDHLFEVVVVAIRVTKGSWEDALLFESHGIVSEWSLLLLGLDVEYWCWLYVVSGLNIVS